MSDSRSSKHIDELFDIIDQHLEQVKSTGDPSQAKEALRVVSESYNIVQKVQNLSEDIG